MCDWWKHGAGFCRTVVVSAAEPVPGRHAAGPGPGHHRPGAAGVPRRRLQRPAAGEAPLRPSGQESGAAVKHNNKLVSE